MIDSWIIYLNANPAVKAGLFFVMGACIGSFLNVLIYRIPRGQEWVKTPSACPSCGHRLGALDLVPILSWMALRGRCRYCGTSISARYALVECVTGIIFALLSIVIPA